MSRSNASCELTDLLRGVVRLDAAHDAIDQVNLSGALRGLVQQASLVQVPLALIRPVLALKGPAALRSRLEL